LPGRAAREHARQGVRFVAAIAQVHAGCGEIGGA
jgi:hypothetical protein